MNGNLSNLSDFQEVENLLDIESFINYMVVHYYAGNYDWGELNWFASLNGADPNGKWHFHSWDQEHAFPNDQNAVAGDGRNQDYDHTQLVTNDFGEHEYGPTGIHHLLMGSDEYRLRFSDRVQALMYNDGLLTPANAQAVWQARVDEISRAINAEAARWGDNRTPDKSGDTWATNVQYTSDHFFFANGSYPSRTDTVIDIFNNTISTGVGKSDWLVDLAAPTFSQYGGEFTAPFDLVIANPNIGGTIYYTLDGTDPRDAGGAISSSAMAYTGTAISLSDSRRVRARIFDSNQSGTANDWSAEIDRHFAEAERLPLRIVELMYNPADPAESEYIEVLNVGAEAIDLTGVQIVDFATEGFTFSGGTLPSGERIVVASNLAAFQIQHPTVTNVVAASYSGSLSNGGETITLLDSFGNVLQSFTYDDEAPWPTTPDGGGPSLVYLGQLTGNEDPLESSPADPFDDPANWQASSVDGGSPGTDGNSGFGLAGDYDNSGAVDSEDYATWKSQFGSHVANGTESDGNGDGVVNLADYVVWRNNLGATSLPAANQSIEATATVESSTKPLLAVDEPDAEGVIAGQPVADPWSHAGSFASTVPVEEHTDATTAGDDTTDTATNLRKVLLLLDANSRQRVGIPQQRGPLAAARDIEAKDALFADLAECGLRGRRMIAFEWSKR